MRLRLIMLIFMSLLIAVFFLLGRFVDVTEPPKPADIIVSLGGDESGCRLKKALQFYREGNSLSGKFLYTHVDTLSNHAMSASGSRRHYLEENGVIPADIVHIDENVVYNTMEEVFFIKKYLLAHHYRSVLFVSHPQHSRRIEWMARYLADYEGSGLTYQVAGCEPDWWHRNTYFQNKTGIAVAVQELVKIVYNFFKYNPLLIEKTEYAHKVSSGEWEKSFERVERENRKAATTPSANR